MKTAKIGISKSIKLDIIFLVRVRNTDCGMHRSQLSKPHASVREWDMRWYTDFLCTEWRWDVCEWPADTGSSCTAWTQQQTTTILLLHKQEAFEKCWAHSPLRDAARPFTRCRHCRTRTSMSTTTTTTTTTATTTTTTLDRGDRYRPIEWAQLIGLHATTTTKLETGLQPSILHADSNNCTHGTNCFGLQQFRQSISRILYVSH